MVKIIGRCNTAVCYTDALDPIAYDQIRAVCDNEAFSDSKIRIMPDVHAGNGVAIGTTMTIHDKVLPKMVGIDIGCGMETVRIAEKDVDFEKLDSLIREKIPYGSYVRDTAFASDCEVDLTKLRVIKYKLDYALRSIGTLGGGNHFIEMDRDDDGNIYLVVHSGSRHLGGEIADFYQQQAQLAKRGCAQYQIRRMIEKLKAEGRFQEIQPTINAMKQKYNIKQNDDLAYAEGELFSDYIHDMKIVQQFAAINRKVMTGIIIEGMGFTEIERFTTVHNYIDTDTMILRKGAVSAKAGEKLLIPMNMRDGSFICIGKGNDDWNQSAPHGAGRLMSRSKAFYKLSMDEYKSEMAGIYSTSVVPETLDESPMAYKSMDDIIRHIAPTVDILCRIKPIYNFKAVC